MQAPKVKLGDKITALQQIVSPFGKVTTHIALTPSLFSFPLLYKYMLLTVLYFSHYLLHYDQFFCWISDRYSICAVWSNRVHKVSSRTSPGGHHCGKVSFHCIMQLYNTPLLLLLLSFFFLSFLMPTKLDFLNKLIPY